MEIQNRIVVQHGRCKLIAKAFNVTDAMVSKALSGKSSSELARKIRYVAKTQYGGREMEFIESQA
jgi:hypothetical protein